MKRKTNLLIYLNCLIMFSPFLFTIPNLYAEPPTYFLCGSDEDGCPEGREEYCACIPVSMKPDQPYCLDFDHMTCKPVAQQPDCSEKHIVVDNQGDCLATMFQSEAYPPCKIVSQSFCYEHSVSICDEYGKQDSCKPPD
ncbi:MAG TPA: hypothetical protein VLI69_05750 [Gammaproteobacteria bacterium]|nr:hypothetical protein [Gammaproteobacteria bacterium]